VEKAAVVELNTTIPALLHQQVVAHGPETILRKKDRGIWNAISWSDLAAQVHAVGQGLRAAGVAPGDAVAVLSTTRPEFVYADLAILGCGAMSVAISPDEEAPRAGDILRETQAAVAIVEGEEQLDKILGVRANCPALRLIIILDMKGLRDFRDPGCIGIAALIGGGEGQSDWQTATATVKADQTAAIVVGRDGVLAHVTHAEIMRQLETTGGLLGVRTGDERLAVLPMCDATERVLGLYLALKYRIVSNYLENPETATENLREVKPTVFGADTEAWERLHARIVGLADSATVTQKLLYNWAIGVGAGGGLLGTLANFLVLPAVRGQLGFGRLRVAYVGDRPVSGDIAEWARALGITVRYINPLLKGETHV
jgi:long-chain acyl-CoA synthetase